MHRIGYSMLELMLEIEPLKLISGMPLDGIAELNESELIKS